MAISFVQEPLVVSTTTSTSGYFAAVTADVEPGTWLIAEVAMDNHGGSGAAITLSITDSQSNTWTIAGGPQNRTPGSVNDDGTTCWIVYCRVTTALTVVAGDYIMFSTGVNVVAKSINVSNWKGIDHTTPVAVAAVGVSAGTTSQTLNINPGAANRLVIGAVAIEGPLADGITYDTDTVNGTWGTLTAAGGTNPTADLNQTIRGQYKIVTATGAQGWNVTLGTARDRAGLIVVFGVETSSGLGFRADSTDTANPGSPVVRPAGSQATTTATANAGAPALARPGTQATTTATANAGTPTVRTAGAQATTTATGNAGAPALARSGAQASCTDTANAGTPVIRPAGSQATGTATGNVGAPGLTTAGTQAVTTAAANTGTPTIWSAGTAAASTDSANAGTLARTFAGAQATTTDTANPGSPVVRPAGTQATTTATANAGSPALRTAGTEGSATDVGTPGSVSVTGGALNVAGSRANSTDTANAGALRVSVIGGKAYEHNGPTRNPSTVPSLTSWLNVEDLAGVADGQILAGMLLPDAAKPSGPWNLEGGGYPANPHNTYLAVGLNGRPMIRINGANWLDSWRNETGPVLSEYISAGAWTVYSTWRVSAWLSDQYATLWEDWYGYLQMFLDGGTALNPPGAGVDGVVYEDPAPSLITDSVKDFGTPLSGWARLRYDGTAIHLCVNGRPEVSTPAGPIQDVSQHGAFIGFPRPFDFGEAAMFNTDLALTDRAAMDAWFEARWGANPNADSAMAGTPFITTAGTRATTTDTPGTGSPVLRSAGTAATETDLALPGTRRVALSGLVALSTDTANAGLRRLLSQGSMATVTDVGNGGSPLVPSAPGRVVASASAATATAASRPVATVAAEGHDVGTVTASGHDGG